MSQSIPEITSDTINARITTANDRILERMAPPYIRGPRHVSKRMAWLIEYANDLAARYGVEIVDGRERPREESPDAGNQTA